MNEATLLEAISEAWGWTGIRPQAIVGENDFGNLIIKDIEARYWRLCPEDGTCKVVAQDRAELDQLAEEQAFLEDWHMLKLVEAANAKLGKLQPGRKYHFVVPPVLGGAYSAENIQTLDLQELIEVAGNIAEQISDLPDGSQVQLVIDEEQ